MLDCRRAPGGKYLDLCAGTLDLAIELRGRPGFVGNVVGADFVVPMLRLGREKTSGVETVGADALELPFGEGTFDGLIVGFGVRNLADPARGLREMWRVIKSGGSLVILEFATPSSWPVRQLYLWYFRRVLPMVGRLVSRHRHAYSYLPASVLDFPGPKEFCALIEDAGFINVAYESLTFGIAGVYTGSKPSQRRR